MAHCAVPEAFMNGRAPQALRLRHADSCRVYVLGLDPMGTKSNDPILNVLRDLQEGLSHRIFRGQVIVLAKQI